MAAQGDKPRSSAGGRPRRARASAPLATDDDVAGDADSARDDDEFGVRLSWPAGTPGAPMTRRTLRPRATERSDRERPADPSFGANDLHAGASTTGADGKPAPVLPVLAARMETIQSLLSSAMGRIDAHGAATSAAIEALSARVDRLSASSGLEADIVAAIEALAARFDRMQAANGLDDAVADIQGSIEALSTQVERLSTPSLDADVVAGIEGGIDALAGDLAEVIGEIAQLSGEIAQLKRRLPVRASNQAESERAQVDAIVSQVTERLGAQLGATIADVVVARLFDVVEVVEIDDPAPPEPPRPARAPERAPARAPERATTPKRRPGRRPPIGR